MKKMKKNEEWTACEDLGRERNPQQEEQVEVLQ